MDLLGADVTGQDSPHHNTVCIQAQVTTFTTNLDLGAKMKVQAEVTDTSSIFVDVGLGFFAEHTLTEASSTTATIVSGLRQKLSQLEDERALIQHDVLQVQQLLKELKQLGNS